MASFSDLPPEIVSHIWGFIHDPRTIESFALSNKGIYVLSGPYLKEHHRLRTLFSAFHSNPRRRFTSKRDQEVVPLEHFVLNPIHALYVTDLNFYHHHVGQRSILRDLVHTLDIDRSSLPQNPCHQTEMRLVVPAVERCQGLSRKDIQDSIDDVANGYEEAILPLLLPNTLNLETICLINLHDVISRRMLSMIYCAALSPSAQFLPKLKNVSLAFSGEPNQGLDAVYAFQAHPSLRSLSIRNLNIDANYPAAHLPRTFYLEGHIKSLSLIDCKIDEMVLLESLRGPRSLEKFSLETSSIKRRHYDASLIRSRLLTYAKHTLQTLDIREPFAHTNYMGSILEFTSLTSITCDSEALLGRSPDGRNYHLTLVESLPNSILTLRLIQNHPLSEILPYLAELTKCKSRTRFPSLMGITLTISSEVYYQAQTLESDNQVSELCEDLKNLDISNERPKLVLKTLEIDWDTHPLQYLEQWKREAKKKRCFVFVLKVWERS